MQYQVALGAQHSPTRVKGGIAPSGDCDAGGVASASTLRVAVPLRGGGVVVLRAGGWGGRCAPAAAAGLPIRRSPTAAESLT